MRALKEIDSEAEFRFFGGDLMTAVGGTRVRHYRELAYMGFIPVLLHLPTILRNMKMCKHDITSWSPDALILVDYPGFNLNIAKYIHNQKQVANSQKPTIFYYISPKIWAWKEYRIKAIKRDIDMLLSILPFEVEFFEQKHHYPIHYIGNPTADEVREFLADTPTAKSQEPTAQKVIALLAGSRRQEIKDNLPAMIEAVRPFMNDYRVVLAGAPGIEAEYYDTYIKGTGIDIVYNQTYPLLAKAHAALVTSGTATLETALFDVPQVVCYETPLPQLIGWLRKKLLKVKYISLVNLVADREVVRELVADSFSVENIRRELQKILAGPDREAMLQGYADVRQRLGSQKAPATAARIIHSKLNGK